MSCTLVDLLAATPDLEACITSNSSRASVLACAGTMQISTGLDSATLHNIIQLLNQYTSAMELTTVISLLQPPPEVFNLFTDVILMAQG